MRKFRHFLLTTAVVLCSTLTTWAIKNGDTYTENGLLYTVTNATFKYVSVGADNFNAESFTIPRTVTISGTEYSVTETTKFGFHACKTLKTLTIPAGVDISESTFSGCTNLQAVTIIMYNNDNKKIGKNAFYGCTNLERVYINYQGILTIDPTAFDNCPKLTYNNYGNAKYFSEGPANSDKAYYYLIKSASTDITSCTIHPDCDAICSDAFSGCTSLSKVEFSSIEHMFNIKYGDPSITNPHHLYVNGREITDLVIPSSVTRLDYRPLDGCAYLTSVTIPNSVTIINAMSPFYSCSALTAINVAADNSNFTSVDGVLFDKSQTEIRSYPIAKEGASYTIPNSVTSIGYSAFYGCTNLTSVTIPSNVTYISTNAFSNCTNLTSITIPSKVSSLKYSNVFSGCSSLVKVTINSNAIVSEDYYSSSNLSNIFGSQVKEYVLGESVTTIGEYAFYDCNKLTSVTIPESVTRIGRYAFCYCTNLTSITIEKATPPNFGSYVFDNTNACPIYVPTPEAVAEYKVAYNMSGYASRIKCRTVMGSIAYEIEETGAKVLANNYSGDIVIPESISFNGNTYPVTIIDGSAFNNCTGLTSVTIPSSVTSIGNAAFYNCSGLTKVTFEGATPPTFGTQVFDNTNNCPIYVPTSAAAAEYKAASNMSSYASRVVSITKAITVEANNNFGTVSGGGEYLPNTTATITAEPAENCIFVRWEDDGEGYTNATRTITVTNDATYTAIFKRVLTVRATANNRTYNGATTATGTLVAEGVAEDDNVTLSYTAATFADKNVGTGKTVTFSGITLGGTNAGNYTLNDVTTTTATADITPKIIAVTATANSRKYDRSIDASGSLSSADIVSDDNVTISYTTAKFENKNVGTNKVVTFSGITIGGTDAANYTLSSTTVTANANITAKGLTLSNFVASEKTFDGTTNATGGSFSDDRVSGDALEFSFDYAFANMNAADAVTVNFRNIAISGGNDKDNYTLLTTSGTGSAKILPVTDEVVLNFTMPTRTVMYNGLANRYEMPTADELFSTNNELYRTYGGFQPADNDAFQAARASVFAQTEVGEYTFGYNSETLVNTSTNFTNVKFNVTDGKLVITPNTNVVVTITENSGKLVYNTEEQSVSGYTITNIEDETGKFAETDITFNGNAVAAGTTIGTYPMELSAADFSHKNTNFANVTFNIVDGALTITKAAVAPNKPEAEMSTLFVNTQLIELPTDWAWTEFKALEEGANTATAEYKGADAGNYEVESEEIAITRNHCDHNGSTAMLYVVEATCTEQGYSGNLSCALCGEIYEYGHATDALGHDFENTVIAPTCTAEGYTEHLCKRCQHIEYSDTVAATGHKTDSVVFENIVAATCTVAGSKDSVVYCSVCKAELSRTKVEIPATGHTVEVDAAVAATATETGLTEGSHCSVCHETIVAQEVIPALGEQGGNENQDGNENQGGSGNENQGNENNNEPATAVSDEAVEAVNIYAYQNLIIVETADAIEGEIAVFDANGRMVAKEFAAGNRTEIIMQHEGLYIVRFGNTSKRVVVY